jgi:tRNA(fMet)-specific endonuclease VapC
VHYARDPAASRRILSRFVTGLTVVPIDDEICDIFGREHGKLRQQGRTVGDFDLLIASTGLRHGLTICTNNRRHFEVIDGVQLIGIA